MRNYLWIIIALLLLLGACNASGNPGAATDSIMEQPDAMMDEKEDDAMMDEKEDDAMMDEKEDDAMMDEKEDDAMMDEKEDDVMMDEKEDDVMMDEKEDDAMMDEKEDDVMMDEKEDDAMMADLPAWQTIALTDAATGESFTLADFAGKTVFVEPMATWCGNCRRQLNNAAQARTQLNDEDIIFVALSVETNLSQQQLAGYSQDAGFDWHFAVATPALLQELVATFGQSITNPPATPHFIIRPDGSYTDLVTGIESPEQLISDLQAAQG